MCNKLYNIENTEQKFDFYFIIILKNITPLHQFIITAWISYARTFLVDISLSVVQNGNDPPGETKFNNNDNIFNHFI